MTELSKRVASFKSHKQADEGSANIQEMEEMIVRVQEKALSKKQLLQEAFDLVG